jgi:hypothetical protein
LQGGIEGISGDGDVNWGMGNIDTDPYFFRLGYWDWQPWPWELVEGDYHLLAECGRYWPEQDIWVLDGLTSPCVDGGDPTVDPSDEPAPNGGCINMGVYGGTAYASMSGCTNPGCRLWYELDEKEPNNIAHDSSDYEHHGVVEGPNDGWEPNDGRFDGCLVFDDDKAIIVPNYVLSNIGEVVAFGVWLNGAYNEDSNNWVFDTGNDDFRVQAAVVTKPEREVRWRAGNDSNDVLTWDLDGIDPRDLAGEWHHWVFLKDENAGEISIWFDFEVVASNSVIDNTLINVRNTPFKIGAVINHNNDFIGKMDDFRVYDRPVCDDFVPCWPPPDYAWAPSPHDYQSDVPRDVNLTWQPGGHVAEHKVFFDTNWEDVNSMTDPCTIKGLGDEEYDPGVLVLDTTYYWRVDEVNGPNIWKGSVWRFTVADYIIIDDFESYNDSTDLIDTWCEEWCQGFEATGAVLRLAKEAAGEPVHSGEQATLYDYDTNSAPYWWRVHDYAEAWLPFDPPRDFNDAGVILLTLSFYGDPNNDVNDTEQMYAGLSDSNGLYAEVRYGDNEGEDMNNLKVEDWYQWNIPLAYFSDGNLAAVPNDVDLRDVNRLYIGFGNRREPVPAGKGIVYFDDVRLSPPVCVPEYGPVADLSGNCIVDFADIEIMAGQWLESGSSLVADLYPDDTIDLKDFAVLADSWLEKKLWP